MTAGVPGPPKRVRWWHSLLWAVLAVTLPSMFGYLVTQRYHWTWPAVLAGYTVLAVLAVWLGNWMQRRRGGTAAGQAGASRDEAAPPGTAQSAEPE